MRLHCCMYVRKTLFKHVGLDNYLHVGDFTDGRHTDKNI